MTQFTSIFDESQGGLFFRFDGDDFVIFMPHLLKKKTIRVSDEKGKVYSIQRMYQFFLRNPERWNEEWLKPMGTAMFLTHLGTIPMQHPTNPSFFEFGFFFGALTQRFIKNKELLVSCADEKVSPEEMERILHSGNMQLRPPEGPDVPDA